MAKTFVGALIGLSVAAVAASATESPNDTAVTAPGGAPITDRAGNTWNLVASPAQGNQIAVNGVVQGNTNHVAELLYVQGAANRKARVWQNAWGRWWHTIDPATPWMPVDGTPVSPLATRSVSANRNVTPSPVDSDGLDIVFEDDFTGTSLSSAWKAYGTVASGTQPIWFNNAGISIDNGFTGTIWSQDGKWFGPGLNLVQGFSPPYRVEMKVLAPPAPGIGPYFLLWPTNNQWPPEIDLAEFPAGSVGPAALTATLHDMSNDNSGFTDPFPVNRAGWIVVTMDLPVPGTGSPRLWLNGVQQTLDPNWATHDNVTIPMSPGIGAVAFPSGSAWYGGITAATPNPYHFQVAYVRVWEADSPPPNVVAAGVPSHAIAGTGISFVRP
jgi:hypothetical protein